MNYVAHLLLTYPQEEISLGNLLGDMIRNKDLDDLPLQVQRGVEVHRAIDYHTDNHRAMRDIVALLRPHHRKYAPVVADILLDHVLLNNWTMFCSIDFSVFEQWVYESIEIHMDAVPTHLRRRLSSMAEHRWLNKYSTATGMQFVLDGMDKRAKYDSAFGSAFNDYKTHHIAMLQGLKELFGDLSDMVDGSLKDASPRSARK